MSRQEKDRSKPSISSQLRLAAALSGGLLALGLLIDLGFTRRQLNEVTRLAGERDRLRAEVQAIEREAREQHDIARYLGGEILSEALAAQVEIDPVSYLGVVVKRAGLGRSDLSTEATTDIEGLRRIRCSLRVHGTYAQLVRCVTELERGTRLVTIESLDIGRNLELGRLEAHLRLSIYDPILTGATK